MSHRYHPDEAMGDPEDAILYDNCERCDEHAEQLYGLDQGNLTSFWLAMHYSKHDDVTLELTKNEAKVINRMYEMAVIIERMTGIWPSPSNLMTLRVST